MSELLEIYTSIINKIDVFYSAYGTMMQEYYIVDIKKNYFESIDDSSLPVLADESSILQMRNLVVLSTNNTQWLNEWCESEHFHQAVRESFPQVASWAHKKAGLSFDAIASITGYSNASTWRWVRANVKQIPRGTNLLSVFRSLFTLGIPTISQIENNEIQSYSGWTGFIAQIACNAWQMQSSYDLEELRTCFNEALNNGVLTFEQAEFITKLVNNPHFIDAIEDVFKPTNFYSQIKNVLF